MPQLTFPITASGDDQHVYKISGGYPPGGSITRAVAVNAIFTERVFGSGQYSIANGLLKFNTSALPDNADITSATLQLSALGFANADGRAFQGEFYQWDGSSSTDYAETASSSAFSIPLSSLGASGIFNIPLSGFTGISPTGNTYIRTHVSGGQPSGDNHFYYAAIENTTLLEPRLVVNYTIGNIPTANFSITGSGLTRTFTDTSTDVAGAIVSRSWTFGDGGTSTAINPSHTYAATGSYTVTLTVTDSDGNTASHSAGVTINNPPVAGFSVSGTGLSRTFTDASSTPVGSITARNWSFGDGGTSTSTNPSHTYTSAGTYTVTLVVTNSNGDVDDFQTTLFIAPTGTGKASLSKHLFSRTTTLTALMNLSQTIASVAELSYWPDSGTVLIDQEQITWDSKTAPNGPGDLIGMSRGANGTTPVSHASGVEVGLLGRHDAGISIKYKAPTLPINAAITLQEIRRFSDSDRFAWADLNNLREQADLEITGEPTSSGNVSTTLDEGGTPTTRTAAVSSTKEVRSLTINNAQSGAGNITVTLDGVAKVIVLPGIVQEKVQIQFAGTSSGLGTAYLLAPSPGAAMTSYSINFPDGATASQMATQTRNRAHTGWVTGGSGSVVTFTATAPGQQAYQFPNLTGQGGVYLYTTPLQSGAPALSAIGVADLIRNNQFPGWNTGGTPGTATVTLTSITSGAKAGAFTYSAGTTGATSTSGITQTAAGTQTTIDQVASAIRAVYSGNTYWTVSGSGNQVNWLATSAGAKQDATFSPGPTGALGRIVTVNQGSTDIVGNVKDSSGVQFWRILANIATSTIFNIETTVSGAGTDKGVVSFWGSFGSDSKVLLRRFERLDLTDYPAGEIAYGVTAESSTGLTWDVLVDEGLLTDRGETYYRDHNSVGELIGQAYYYGLLAPEQAQQDLFVQDFRQPVLPGEEIALALYMRFENLPASVPPQPVYITCHKTSGEVVEIGSATPTLSGDAAWLEYVPTPFVVPADCYELRLNSRDMSQGTVVIQELCDSSGTIVKRTRYYALDGSFRAQLDMRMPSPSAYLQIERERTVLETVYEANSGIVVPQYRSASDPASFDATWYTDASEVPDLPVIDADVTLSGDGVSTPEVPAGYPRVEYRARPHKRHLFLKGDRTEFPGGVLMNKVADWYRKPGTGSILLPSGHTRKQKLHDPVGFLPSFELWAFRPQTVQYLLENLNRAGVLFCAEVFNELLLLKVLIEPEFARATLSRYDNEDLGLTPATERYALWVSNELSAEVLGVTKIPE